MWVRHGGRVNNNPGATTSMIWLDEVDCIGHEQSLMNCSHNDLGVNDCTHIEDVGVACNAAPPTQPPTTPSPGRYTMWVWLVM